MPRRPAKPRVTSHDVALRAGVSQPTVSLVLSHNPTARVAAETRARIVKAAQELGYRPNLVARSLVRRRSFALGVIVPDFRNPFFADVVHGAERVAAEEGYAVLLSEAGESSPVRHVEALQERLIDGVIIDAVGAASVPDDLLVGTNVVLIDQTPGRWPGIATDAESAGVQVAEHLLGLGHRTIAFIGPSIDSHAFRMRERGFVRRLRQAGVTLDSFLLRRAPATVAGGQRSMRALLAEGTRPTAVFCVNDLVALGALKACSEAHVRVPDDISIAGCDDIEMARLVTPELTTVTVPARELGARAARLLIHAIEGRKTKRANGGAPLLPVHLVARGTTGAVGGGRP